MLEYFTRVESGEEVLAARNCELLERPPQMEAAPRNLREDNR